MLLAGWPAPRGICADESAGAAPSSGPEGATSPASTAGLTAAAALEETLVSAIARCEKSVVSIARVAEKGSAPGDMLPEFMGRPRFGGVG